MRKRGVPKTLTDWAARKLRSRHTILTFDGFRSDPYTLDCGADQGCPISGPLFQFYDADLLDIPRRDDGEDSIAFVDDTSLLTVGDTM
ncbi:hypothetical protein BV25DRAFT_1766755, partial [Artomyces pyxidatus]